MHCLTELRWLYDRRDGTEARQHLAAWLERWQAKYPKLTTWAEEQIEETFTFYRLPQTQHPHLKSANLLEIEDGFSIRLWPRPEGGMRSLLWTRPGDGLKIRPTVRRPARPHFFLNRSHLRGQRGRGANAPRFQNATARKFRDPSILPAAPRTSPRASNPLRSAQDERVLGARALPGPARPFAPA